MDGLLIDSEPLWKHAEVDVLANVGVPLTYEMTNQTMGLRTDEVVRYWFDRYPWLLPAQNAVAREINDRLIQLIAESGTAKLGVNEAVAVIRHLGLPMAIASSSTEEIIDAVLNRLDVREYISVVHSAQHELYGKPHPAVYLAAADKLGVQPTECLAFEDSVNGVLAAKAAKMVCIAIPEPELRSDRRFGIADLILDSLNDFTAEMLSRWD